MFTIIKLMYIAKQSYEAKNAKKSYTYDIYVLYNTRKKLATERLRQDNNVF